MPSSRFTKYLNFGNGFFKCTIYGVIRLDTEKFLEFSVERSRNRIGVVESN